MKVCLRYIKPNFYEFQYQWFWIWWTEKTIWAEYDDDAMKEFWALLDRYRREVSFKKRTVWETTF